MTEPLDMINASDIDRILDATRIHYGIRSDEKLAQFLGVSDQAIYRWRRGEIAKSARVLVALMRMPNITKCLESETAP